MPRPRSSPTMTREDTYDDDAGSHNGGLSDTGYADQTVAEFHGDNLGTQDGLWRDSQSCEVIQDIENSITGLKAMRRPVHKSELAGLIRGYYNRTEATIQCLFKYLEISFNENLHGQGPRNHHTTMLSRLRESINPLRLILGSDEIHEFLCDAKNFRNYRPWKPSDQAPNNSSLIARFLAGNIPEQLESELGIALDCVKDEAGRRHSQAGPFETWTLHDLASEVFRKRLYFHDRRAEAREVKLESKIESLEDSMQDHLGRNEVLEEEPSRRRLSQTRAEEQHEGIQANMRDVIQALTTHREDLEATIQDLQANQDEAIRAAESLLKAQYENQHDYWLRVLRWYRTSPNRVSLEEQFVQYVEELGQEGSGANGSWLELRRETNLLRVDANNANLSKSTAESERDDAVRKRDSAIRERDALRAEMASIRVQQQSIQQYHRPAIQPQAFIPQYVHGPVQPQAVPQYDQQTIQHSVGRPLYIVQMQGPPLM